MGGGHKSNKTKTYIRYAGYIESAHNKLLKDTRAYVDGLKNESPLSNFEDIPIDVAFFGTGFVLSDFPSLYDMGGKFVFGLDIGVLFDQVFEDTVNAPAVKDLVASEGVDLLDDIEENVLPEYESGLHDLGAINTSSFHIGKAILYGNRTKALSKFSAEVRTKLIPVATERWTKHLQWNMDAVKLYEDLVKLFYLTKVEVDKYNYGMKIEDALWPFKVLDFQRAAVGVLQGAQSTTTKTSGGGGGIMGVVSSVLDVVGLASLFSVF